MYTSPKNTKAVLKHSVTGKQLLFSSQELGNMLLDNEHIATAVDTIGYIVTLSLAPLAGSKISNIWACHKRVHGTFSPIAAQRCIHYFGGYITGMCRYGIHWDRRLHTTNREEYLLAHFFRTGDAVSVPPNSHTSSYAYQSKVSPCTNHSLRPN